MESLTPEVVKPLYCMMNVNIHPGTGLHPDSTFTLSLTRLNLKSSLNLNLYLVGKKQTQDEHANFRQKEWKCYEAILLTTPPLGVCLFHFDLDLDIFQSDGR